MRTTLGQAEQTFVIGTGTAHTVLSVEDLFGHRINYLRISVTDRCNERCAYCLPDEVQTWAGREETLTDDEIVRLTAAGARLGISKIRVTGGEPLTRPGVVDLIGRLKTCPGIRQIGLSSNGTLLARSHGGGTLAEALRRAGVDALNLSLDSLDRETYARTTGRDFLPRFLDGLRAAQQAGFASIRLNCVLMRGTNEHELWDLVEFAREQGCLIRFIELMPVSSRHVLTEENFLSVGEARRLLEFRLGPLTPLPDFKTLGPATYFAVPTTDQRIGFIGAMTNLHFCESCNKLRLTADGKLRPCLGSHLEFDFRHALRGPATSDADLERLFLEVVARKPREHEFRDNYQPQRRMIAIGG
ncbi:MAG: cyclic pyranopterin phosphate synthase [Verrucomicrobia bacterium]|jgi:cyclic pyranopterin phosphate synthase|nr:MAG: cyclic pyranopterin phosphate synthase [Verrucomicrobiota bacterium]